MTYAEKAASMAESEKTAFAESEISRITDKDVTIIKKEVPSTELSIAGIRSRRARKIKPKRFMDDEDYLPTTKKVCIKEEVFHADNNEDVQGSQKSKYKKMQNRNIRKKTNKLRDESGDDSLTQYPKILDTPKGQIILRGSYDEASTNKSPSALKIEVEAGSGSSHVMIQTVQGLAPFVMQGNNEAMSAISIGSSHFQGAGFILPKIPGSNTHKNESMSGSTESNYQKVYSTSLDGLGSDLSGKGWLKSWPPHEQKTSPDIFDIQAPLNTTDSRIVINAYHMSIVPPGDNFKKFRENIKRCSKLQPVKPNCRNCFLGRNAYHCPLCPHYKALSVTLFNRHVRIHTEPNRRCLHVRGFRIMNCKNICKSRQTSHYHCPFCPTILEKMSRALYHIENCRMPKALQGKIKPTVKCPICTANLSKGSLAEHIRGQHGEERSDPEEIGASRFHFSCLVDGTRSIYSSSKSFLGPGTPLHCVASDSEKFCESRACMEKIETDKRLGHPDPMCKHMLSVPYAQQLPQGSDIQLSLEVLNKLTPLKISQEMRERLKELYRCAMKNESPLIVMIPKKPIKNAPVDPIELDKQLMDRQIFFSVFSGNGHHKKFRLGRIIVTKEKSGAIHCRCTKERDCVHRWCIRWFIYQKGNEPVIELSQKADQNLVGAMEAQEAEVTLELHDDDSQGGPVVQRYNNQGTLDVPRYPEEDYPNYPPTGRCLKRMIKYIRTQKRIRPDNIPVLYDVGLIPRQLIPRETKCYFCKAALSEPMPSTRRARLILLDQEPLEDFETFYKMCTNNKCNTPYSYREYEYGIFNFNDCYLLSFSFLLHFRENLMNHSAIGRVIKKLPWSSRLSQVMRQTALRDAYFLFESLIDHSYDFFCVRCGYHPAILRHKLMSKAVLVKKGEDVVRHDGQGEFLRSQVQCGNMDSFWVELTSLPIATAINSIRHKNKITGRSFEIGEFRLSRRDADGAIYLGKQTRRPEFVCSYNYAKEEMIPTQPFTQNILQEGQPKVPNDILISEESGINNNTSADRTTSSSSSGWFISACPHGVTYSIKNDLSAKGAEALVEVLSNFEHIPTVNITENADTVANIGNTREHEMFTPHKGRLAEASEENVSMAQDDNILVHLDYMRDEELVVSSISGEVHPITGTANKHMLFPSTGQHYQPWVEKLRCATLVPELCGKIDTPELQELFNGVEADCYWLNFLSPSNHLFTMRLLAHLRNKKINDEELQLQGRILNATTTTITYGRSDTLTETTIDLALNHLGQIVKCPPAPALINTSCSAASSRMNNKNPYSSSLRNTSAVNPSFINPATRNINSLMAGKIPSALVVKNTENLPSFILNECVDVNIVRCFFSEESWADVENIIKAKREKLAEAEAIFMKLTDKEKQEKILSWCVTDEQAKQIVRKTRLENLQENVAEIVLNEIN